MAASDFLRLVGQGGQSGRRMAKEFVPKLKGKQLHGGQMVALHCPAYSGKLRDNSRHLYVALCCWLSCGRGLIRTVQIRNMVVVDHEAEIHYKD